MIVFIECFTKSNLLNPSFSDLSSFNEASSPIEPETSSIQIKAIGFLGPSAGGLTVKLTRRVSSSELLTEVEDNVISWDFA